MPGIVLNTSNIIKKNKNDVPTSMGLTFYWNKQNNASIDEIISNVHINDVFCFLCLMIFSF